MKENKHTPAPWVHHSENFHQIIGIDKCCHSGATVAMAYGFTQESANANANLISAAPDLLAALEWFQDAYKTGASCMDAANEAAKKAIRKAKGE